MAWSLRTPQNVSPAHTRAIALLRSLIERHSGEDVSVLQDQLTAIELGHLSPSQVDVAAWYRLRQGP